MNSKLEGQRLKRNSSSPLGWRDGITCRQVGGMDLGGGCGWGIRLPSWAGSVWLVLKGWENFDTHVWAGQMRLLRWMVF